MTKTAGLAKTSAGKDKNREEGNQQLELLESANREDQNRQDENQLHIKQTTQNDDEALLEPSDEEARELCRLAREIQLLAPWEFMEEMNLFGVQDPVSGEIGFVSVMGSVAEYLAIAVYRGSEGLDRWFDFEDELQRNQNSQKARDLVAEIPQLHLHFSEPEFLEKRDRQIIKQSGIKFGSEKPIFRSYRPGYWPWFITRDEARQLIIVLTQAIDVFQRCEEDAELLPDEEDELTLLIRVPQMQQSEIVWSDEIRTIKDPVARFVPLAVDDQLVTNLKLHMKQGAVEIDIITVPGKVGKKSERPQAVFALLMADPASEFVLGLEVLDAKDGIDLVYAGMPERVASMLLKADVVPEVFLLCSERLLDVLEPFAIELGIRPRLVEDLPVIENVRTLMLEQMFGMGGA